MPWTSRRVSRPTRTASLGAPPQQDGGAEVGPAPSAMRRGVGRAPYQARAGADDGDVAVEFDVGQSARPGLPLEGGQLLRGKVVGVPVGGVVIEHELGVDAEEAGPDD